jgi:predicted nucleic acid-binding protein
MAVFLDSNIVIYAFSDDIRKAVSLYLLGQDFEISVQVLNELVNVSRRKMRKDWRDIEASLTFVRMSATIIHPLTNAAQLHAVKLSQRFGYTIYDSSIIAVALEAGCETLFSEDMQHGMLIEDRLTIRNPFALS